MNKKRNFDNILDECLTRLQRGESIEACLADHPEHAGELEPLLRTVLDARQAAAVKPRQEYRQRAAIEFQAAIREMPVKGAGGRTLWRRRFMEVLAGVVFVLLAGTGLVSASSSSLPDEPLYPIKTATETAWLALTPSQLDKAELYVKFTDRRVKEIIAMAGEGKVAPIDKATVRLDSQMVAMAGLTATEKGATAMTSGMESSPPMLAAPASTTTAATTTPAPTTTAVPGTTPPPTTTWDSMAPSPETTIMTTPPPVTSESDRGAGTETVTAPAPAPQALKHANAELDEQAELREILAQSAASNSMALQEELDKAPESVREALQRALDVANSGYQTNLSNLGY